GADYLVGSVTIAAWIFIYSPGQVVAECVGNVDRVAGVVVPFNTGAAEGFVVNVRCPGADKQTALMTDIQRSLDRALTGGLRLAAPDVVRRQGNVHAGYEIGRSSCRESREE